MSLGWSVYDLTDWSLFGLGFLALAAVTLQLFRNPTLLRLDDSNDALRHEPELPALALVVLVWMLGVSSLPSLLGLTDPRTGDPTVPGSTDWMRLELGDAGLKVLLSLLMAVVLVRAHRRNSAESDAIRATLGEPPPPVRTHTVARRITNSIGLGVLVALALLPFCYVQLLVVNQVWDWLRPDQVRPQHPTLEWLTRLISNRQVVILLLVKAAVITPLIEELFFRGVLLGSVRRLLGSSWSAVLLSSVAFGLVHMGVPASVLPLTSMGVVLAVLRIRAGLAACVIAHGLFNVRTLALALIDPARIEG